MKRGVVGCSLIAAYCLVAAFLMFHSLHLANAQVSTDTTQTAVLATQSVLFEQLPDSPDPNAVFTLANQARVQAGSKPLQANAQLADIALARARDMAARQYYAHKNPDGQYYYDAFPSAGITVDYSCENLDIVFVPDITQFIDQWLASTHGHRECLTNPDLTQAGYAVTNMILLEYGGKQVPAYLVVAIHSTDLK